MIYSNLFLYDLEYQFYFNESKIQKNPFLVKTKSEFSIPKTN